MKVSKGRRKTVQDRVSLLEIGGCESGGEEVGGEESGVGFEPCVLVWVC